MFFSLLLPACWFFVPTPPEGHVLARGFEVASASGRQRELSGWPINTNKYKINTK